MDILSTLASIGNASNSYGTSNGFGDSWQTASSGQQATSYGYSDASSEGEAWSKTYGTQASAMDILRAQEANEIQKDMWTQQALYNSAEAEKNRQYQTLMSNTAYQRAVEDLKRAGLNPILAAMNMGASTPSGSTASSGLATAHKAQTYANSESASKSYSKSHSENSSQSSGWSQSQGGSHNENSSYNETKTQLMQLIDSVAGLLGGSSGSKVGEDKSKGRTYSSGDFTGGNTA